MDKVLGNFSLYIIYRCVVYTKYNGAFEYEKNTIFFIHNFNNNLMFNIRHKICSIEHNLLQKIASFWNDAI